MHVKHSIKSQMSKGDRCQRDNKQESRKSSECKRWAKDSKSRLIHVRKLQSNRHQSIGCKLTEEEKHQSRRSNECKCKAKVKDPHEWSCLRKVHKLHSDKYQSGKMQVKKTSHEKWHMQNGGKFVSEKVKQFTRQINTMASKEREIAQGKPVCQAQWTVKTVEGESRGDPTPKLNWRSGASAIHTQVVAHVVIAPIRTTKTRGKTRLEPNQASNDTVQW